MHLKDVDQLSQLLANFVFRVRKFACSIAIHLREAEEKQNGHPAIVERAHLGLCKKKLFSSGPVKLSPPW